MILSGHAEDGPKDWSHCRREFETRGSTLSHGHHEHHEHHGNPWQPMATYGMPLLVSVYTLRHRRRLLVSPIKNRRDHQDPILWSAEAALMTYVDSSTLRYTQVILLSCCISFSFVEAFFRYYHQVISDLSRLQLVTRSESIQCDMAWPVPSESPRPKQLQLCPGAVWPVHVVMPVVILCTCIHLISIYR